MVNFFFVAEFVHHKTVADAKHWLAIQHLANFLAKRFGAYRATAQALNLDKFVVKQRNGNFVQDVFGKFFLADCHKWAQSVCKPFQFASLFCCYHVSPSLQNQILCLQQ